MRRKREPCEYCDQGYDDWTQVVSEDCEDLTIELYPGHVIAAHAVMTNVHTEERYDASVSIPFNYCPNCGRKWGM